MKHLGCNVFLSPKTTYGSFFSSKFVKHQNSFWVVTSTKVTCFLFHFHSFLPSFFSIQIPEDVRRPKRSHRLVQLRRQGGHCGPGRSGGHGREVGQSFGLHRALKTWKKNRGKDGEMERLTILREALWFWKWTCCLGSGNGPVKRKVSGTNILFGMFLM